MKKFAIMFIIFSFIISCSTSKFIIDKDAISSLNSNSEKINCIVHNYIAKNKAKQLFSLKYKFRIVVEYKDFDKNKYQLYLTDGFDFKNIDAVDLINHLKENEIFNNSLIELKKGKNNLIIVGDTIYSIINIKSLKRHDVKAVLEKNSLI